MIENSDSDTSELTNVVKTVHVEDHKREISWFLLQNSLFLKFAFQREALQLPELSVTSEHDKRASKTKLYMESWKAIFTVNITKLDVLEQNLGANRKKKLNNGITKLLLTSPDQ